MSNSPCAKKLVSADVFTAPPILEFSSLSVSLNVLVPVSNFGFFATDESGIKKQPRIDPFSSVTKRRFDTVASAPLVCPTNFIPIPTHPNPFSSILDKPKVSTLRIVLDSEYCDSIVESGSYGIFEYVDVGSSYGPYL